MYLQVHQHGQSQPVTFPYSKYTTNDKGELDILSDESEFVVATFATTEWSYVCRVLEDGEEWPTPVYEEVSQEEFEQSISGSASRFGINIEMPGS